MIAGTTTGKGQELAEAKKRRAEAWRARDKAWLAWDEAKLAVKRLEAEEAKRGGAH